LGTLIFCILALIFPNILNNYYLSYFLSSFAILSSIYRISVIS
jgi:hypothetical protein